jgi:hypothetical protein
MAARNEECPHFRGLRLCSPPASLPLVIGEGKNVQFLTELWLPILLSTVFVFIASCVIHMVVPIHKADYRGVKDEPRLLEAVRALNIAPGEYYFPWCSSMREMRSAEFVQKRIQGPIGILTVMQPGPPGMGRNLVQWILFTLVIAVSRPTSAIWRSYPALISWRCFA